MNIHYVHGKVVQIDRNPITVNSYIRGRYAGGASINRLSILISQSWGHILCDYVAHVLALKHWYFDDRHRLLQVEILKFLTLVFILEIHHHHGSSTQCLGCCGYYIVFRVCSHRWTMGKFIHRPTNKSCMDFYIV